MGGDGTALDPRTPSSDDDEADIIVCGVNGLSRNVAVDAVLRNQSPGGRFASNREKNRDSCIKMGSVFRTMGCRKIP